ncbi:M14 family metallocarboxypeptidase [Luteolibacter pohnpeiensis]|uniref:M14 family metallocarboxypeptidase n=1 Tax=Luteolibacter pohnpeiensis TaxID=454153 RepID=A0A934S840_9BACT|nr:M14 family metallocarboxypeptidase [Luteolibacter pohnpeiensis]MBK1883050.1 M14 family metallocarboxypeptidase [Luteolibacter pohnpeiensis]
MSDVFDWPAFLPEFHREATAAGFSPTLLHETESGPIHAWERPGHGPVVYLSAGIHGDEPAGPMAMLRLLKEGFFATDHHWLICPALNPNGLACHVRENADGHDLNRDYLAFKSEEARCHAAWLDRQPTPALFVSLHEDWESSGFYLYEINLSGSPTETAHRILDAVSPWFHPEPGPEIDGHTCHEPGWIYHSAEPDLPESWPEAIYLAKKGCPLSFTFESPSSSPLEPRIASLAAGVRAACEYLD